MDGMIGRRVALGALGGAAAAAGIGGIASAQGLRPFTAITPFGFIADFGELMNAHSAGHLRRACRAPCSAGRAPARR
jgi:hypothetical protein